VKMEPIVSSETSAIRTQTPGNYPKRNKLHLEHGESLKTRRDLVNFVETFGKPWLLSWLYICTLNVNFPLTEENM